MLLLNLILIHVVLISIILIDNIQGSIDNLCNFDILLVKGKLIGLLPKLDKEFLVSFDVYPKKFVAGYHSVIHLTIGSNYGQYGDRVPGIWFNDKGDGSIYISAPISGNINKFFITNPIKLNNWSNVKVSQILKNFDYVYTIRLNGEVVFTYINNNVQSFDNVKVYASDPWHDVQDGLIRNLFIITGISSNGLQPIVVLPTDIDKCANLTDYCNWANSDCLNTNGSYYFTCKCVAYYFIYCNWAISDCLNTNGSYYFTCMSGWRLKNNSCVDIDECANLTDHCNWANSDCVNTNGSYYCTCKSGWRLNNNSCVDVNECNELPKYCNLTNSDCVNTNGSYNCTCKSGWILENNSCVGSLLQWSNWSSCNTSNGYGFTNRTRYLADKCYTEQKECYVYKAPLWNVFNTVSMEVNLTLLNLQIYPTFIKPSNVSLEFEYFLPPFFTFISDSVIQRFVKTQANRLRYSFNGNFTYLDSFNYNFTATYNNSLCPISGVFMLKIPLMLSLQVETEKCERIVRTFQKQVECFDNPKIPVSSNQEFLKESYGRGIYWDEYNSHIYVCMSQHHPSTKSVCYFSDDEGYLWTAMDVQVGFVLGRHSVTKELYAVHRNRKMYLMFHNYYKKWLAITNQQFLDNAFNQLNSTFVKNLEGDNEQIYTLGPYQWLGNAEGLFFRKLKNDSWIQRVKWIL
nr:uncharacterized protein LOC101240703 isoform X4 [Hydra vulgaris]